MPDMNMQTYEEVHRHQLVTEFDIQSQSELTDYQVKLENVSNPTQAPDNLVVGVDGEALSHWNESVDFDTWVKMMIEVSGKHGLLIHGNSGLSSGSSGSDVFIQYHGAASSAYVDTLTSNLVGPIIVEGNVRATASSHNLNWGIAETAANGGGDRFTIKSYSIGADIYGYSTNDGTESIVGRFDEGGFVLNQWYDIKISYDGTTARFYFDDTELEDGNTLNIPNENMGLQYYAQTGTGEQEYLYARKYTAIEPTIQISTPKNISTALKSFGRAG